MKEGWALRKLEDFVRFRNGKSIKAGTDGSYPVYGSNGIIGSTDDFMYDDAIILGRVGAYCGSVERSFGRFWASDNTIVVEPDVDVADTQFVYYLLLDAGLNRHAGGAAQPLLTQSRLKPLEFLLPPLPTQQRIAAILSAYDDLIENNTRRIAILEEMARRLYEEWLLPQADGRGWSEVPVSQTLAGHIGGGWGKEDADEGHPDRAFVIRGTDIPGARVLDVEKCPLRYHAKSNLRSRRLVDGDLVMEVSGGSKDQLVGRPLLVSDRLLRRFNDPVMCASFCKRLQVKQEAITPLLLYHYLSRAYVAGTMAQFQVQSTGITNFQFKPFLEKAHVPIPPRELQSLFQSIAGPMRDQIELLGEANANLRAQRDLLLPKLVSGEIDVSGAEAVLEAAE